ncbi:MAG TPA: PDZ domain-containing protein, partial [Reyranella sp.]
VPLTAPPEKPLRDRSALQGRHPLSGATVVNMSPAVADELGLVEWKWGVAVVEVQPGSYASRFLRPGDMVSGINGQDVKSVSDLKQRVAGGVQSLSIGREGLISTIQFR